MNETGQIPSDAFFRVLSTLFVGFFAVFLLLNRPAGETPRYLVILFGFYCWVYLFYFREVSVPARKSFLFLLGFALLTVLSSIVSEILNPSYYALYLKHLGGYAFWEIFMLLPVWPILVVLSFCVMSVDFDDAETRRRWLNYFLLGILGLAVLGGVSTYLIKQGWTGGRLTIFGYQWNHTALFFNGLMFFLLGFNFYEEDGVLRGFNLAVVFAGVAIIYLTRSRGGLISLVCGGICFSYFYLYEGVTRRKIINIVLIVLVSLLVISVLPGSEHTVKRFGETQSLADASGRTNKIWPATLTLIKEGAWFGHPVGSYHYFMYQRFEMVKLAAHNMILQILYEGGLFGALLFIFFSYYALREPFDEYRQDHPRKFLSIAFFTAFFTTVVVHGVVEAVRFDQIALMLGCYYVLVPDGNILISSGDS